MKRLQYKKLAAVILCLASMLAAAATARADGVVFGYPFVPKFSRDEEGRVILKVKEQSGCRVHSVEESEFLYMVYIESDFSYCSDVTSGTDQGKLMRYMYSHPDKIKCLYERENIIPCDKNKIITAALFFRHNGEIYMTSTPEGFDFTKITGFPDDLAQDNTGYQDTEGMELRVTDPNSYNAKVEYDFTYPADARAYTAFYDNEGQLAGIFDPSDNRAELTSAEGVSRLWMHRTLNLGWTDYAYCRAFAWDGDLKPKAASSMTAFEQAGISVEETSGGLALTITQEDVGAASIYGPSVHQLGSDKYLKTLRRRDITGQKTLTLTEKGRYLAVLTSSNGVEYKRIIDNY